MADISVQFHALPRELLSMVKDWIDQFNLRVVAMKFHPFEAVEIDGEQLDRIFADVSPYRELAFLTQTPVLPATSNEDFFDKNPDKLRLDIGRKTDRGLEQSWLTSRTQNLEVSAIWKGFARDLKKVTHAGVVAINPETRAAVKISSYRYTDGAQLAASTGVPILPPAGTARLRFDVTTSKGTVGS
jgi:hypothetical protein